MRRRRRGRTARRAIGTAAAVPLLLAGAHADDALAKTFTVSSKRASGKGSLSGAIGRANRHEGSDRIVFRSRLSGNVELRRKKVTVRGPLTIAGNGRGRRGPVVRGSSGGTRLVLDPPYRRNAKDPVKLQIRDLALERVSLGASGSPTATDLRVVRSRLSGDGVDRAGIVNGGGYGSSDLTLRNSTVEGFSGTGVDAESNYGDTLIKRSVIRRNSSGVLAFKAGVDIKNSTISGNSPGGGIFVTYYAFADVTKSTISGNRTEGSEQFAAAGGGVNAYYEAFARITNSTISGNAAVGTGSMGGGIYGGASVVSSTVTNNSAERGGGIFSAPDGFGTDGVNVTDSIVTGNRASDGPDCGGETDTGPPQSKGGNVFGRDGCATPQPTDLLTGDPRLGPLAGNGGPTKTHELLAGSPAIDHSGRTELETDQRGVRRGKHPDSGSFERR